jgi:hypothetical protein
MILLARRAIKEYPNFNKIKSRIGMTKAQVEIQNRKIKSIKAKQKEDIDLTAQEQLKLNEVMVRKREIYSKAMKVLGR